MTSTHTAASVLFRTLSVQLLLATLVLLCVGCGKPSDRPQLGQVEGTVTLDGNPVSAAMVSFRPKASGRSSTAISDEQGAYRIRYDREFGAIVGEHTVYISTYRGPNGDSPGVAELIPKRYNTDTELTVAVEKGSQVINFQLEDVPDENKPKPPKLRNPDFGD